MTLDARMSFLLLTALLLAILVIIGIATYNKKRKNELEAPKHRMLEDD